MSDRSGSIISQKLNKYNEIVFKNFRLNYVSAPSARTSVGSLKRVSYLRPSSRSHPGEFGMRPGAILTFTLLILLVVTGHITYMILVINAGPICIRPSHCDTIALS